MTEAAPEPDEPDTYTSAPPEVDHPQDEVLG